MRSNIQVALGTALRKRRKALRLTQAQLGELAGTGPVFISQLERGKETVRLDKVVAVLEVLGVDLSLVPGQGGFQVDKRLL